LTSPAFNRLQGGYWNAGLKSAGNPGGMAGPGAARENWPLMLADVAAVIAEGSLSASAAEAAAASAFSAPGSKSTSTSTIAMPVKGAIVPVIVQEDNRVYVGGQTAVVSVTGDFATQFAGLIVGWNQGTKLLQVRTDFVHGVGTHNAWTIGLTAPIDDTLSGRVAALEIANARARRRACFSFKEFIA